MVSQEPTLFACSIKDNIAYGKQASFEEVCSELNGENVSHSRSYMQYHLFLILQIIIKPAFNEI